MMLLSARLLYVFVLFILGHRLERAVYRLDRDRGYLLFLTNPVHLKLLGANKTWRGIVVLPLLLAGTCYLFILGGLTDLMGLTPADTDVFWVAGLCGLACQLGELPNSFIKRQLGISPGEQPTLRSLGSVAQFVVDHTDSWIAVCLHLWLVVGWRLSEVAVAVPIAAVLHSVTNWSVSRASPGKLARS